jgi:hypothetical protein
VPAAQRALANFIVPGQTLDTARAVALTKPRPALPINPA